MALRVPVLYSRTSFDMRTLSLFASAAFALVALTGCSKDESQTPEDLAAATDTPVEAVQAAAKHLRAGDLLAAMQVSLPPAEVERMKAEWATKREAQPADAAEDAEYAEMMAKLTAANAEQQIFDELEPQLAKFETEMAAQIPMMIGMGQGFAAQSIAANEKLSDDQKKQATEAVAATAVWLQTVPWADREVLKRAIGKAVSTAREIDLPTMEKARTLEFEQAVGKASIAFKGVKDILALYGLSIDSIFDSVRAEEVSQNEGLATVRVNFKLFDKALWHDTEMTRVEGRWYGKDTVEQIAAARAGLVE